MWALRIGFLNAHIFCICAGFSGSAAVAFILAGKDIVGCAASQ